MDFCLMRRERNRRKRIAISRLRMKLRHVRMNSTPYQLPDCVFNKLFRLEKKNVMTLVSELSVKSNFNSIPFKIQVLATLHFYGQGSYQASIGSNHVLGLSQPSVSRCVENVTNLIMKYLVPRSIRFKSNDKLNQNKRVPSFTDRFFNKYGIRNIIGAIDGVHIAIIAPPENSIDTPGKLYISRKGYHSLNVLLCCNADLKIIFADASFPGSVHDSAIWKTSQLRSHLLNRFSTVHSQAEFMIGDSGFPLEPWLLNPYANPSSDAEVNYNVKFIKTRNCVERCFGIIKTRFRCVFRHRVLHYCPKKAAHIIYAVFALHNMFIEDRAINEELIDFEDNPDLNEQLILIDDTPSIDNYSTRQQWHNLGSQIRDIYAANV